MKIEIGKTYQLRGGETVDITKEVFSVSRNKASVIYYGITEGDLCSEWDEHGKWIPDKDNTEMEIIAERTAEYINREWKNEY